MNIKRIGGFEPEPSLLQCKLVKIKGDVSRLPRYQPEIARRTFEFKTCLNLRCDACTVVDPGEVIQLRGFHVRSVSISNIGKALVIYRLQSDLAFGGSNYLVCPGQVQDHSKRISLSCRN